MVKGREVIGGVGGNQVWKGKEGMGVVWRLGGLEVEDKGEKDGGSGGSWLGVVGWRGGIVGMAGGRGLCVEEGGGYGRGVYGWKCT